MRTFLVVAVAVAISGAAFAKDLKGSIMTDSEMDKVTAGQPGLGVFTALDQSSKAVHAFGGLGAHAVEHVPSGIAPGCGIQTVTNCPSQ